MKTISQHLSTLRYMPNKKLDFLFLIEHHDREYQSVQNISNELLFLGYSSKILSIEFHLHKIMKYEPKVIILPYLFSKDLHPVDFITYFKNSIYFSLNWEQLLTGVNKEFKSPRDDFSRNQIFHYSWDKEFTNFLCSSGVNEKNIFLGGNVLHQILHSKNLQRTTHKKELAKEFKLDSKKEWCFLPMNYSWAFISSEMIQSKIKNGYPADKAYKYNEYAKQCLVYFISFLKEVLSKYKNVEFILRPHPSISIDDYAKLIKNFSEIDNLIITKKHTISEWIVSSDYVGSSWSTSVWDASKIGKKTFLFTPIEKPEWHKVWWEPKVTNISSAQDLELEKLNSTEHKINDLDKISLNLAKTLIEIKENENPKRFSNNFKLKYILVYLRSFIREISIKYFNGIFIKKGMMRDYFNENEN